MFVGNSDTDEAERAVNPGMTSAPELDIVLVLIVCRGRTPLEQSLEAA